MRIAFLGLGAMGVRMAGNILAQGHDLTVWNRSPGKTEPLVAKSARSAETPREAAKGAEVVISMLLNDEASKEVWTDPETGALQGMDPEAVAVESSTISVAWCHVLAEAARDKGIAFVEAPVAGTLQPAEAGQLVIVVGGDEDAIAKAGPAFDAMGKATHRAGPNGSAAMTKLVINGMLAAQEAQLAELLGAAKRLGVDHRRAFEILCETPVASPMLKSYGQLMVDGTDDVNFSIRNILKDIGLIEEAAAQANSAAPVIKGVRAAFEDAAEAGLADRNQTEIMRRHD